MQSYQYINLFKEFCKKNKFEINVQQIEIIKLFNKFLNPKKNFSNFFFKSNNKLCFYLHGNIGVGKTMLLNFVYDRLKMNKLRLHFNEFMIKFHEFIFENKKKAKYQGLEKFVEKLSDKTQILYFDEFQVTNIVDAMILGKLFKKIFEENIKVIFSSNIKIKDLYKNGLQRDQFMPFIKILEHNCSEIELEIPEDYRTNKNIPLDRFLSPIDESSNFKFNKFFRKMTKNKEKTTKILDIKGRKLIIENFYDRVTKFNFDELFNNNLGSEDYIRIAKESDLIFIENLPNFNEDNSNQQQRFITFIDIIYEKKIPLMIKSEVDLNSLCSSKSLTEPFKRTLSRLYEMTSQKLN